MADEQDVNYVVEGEVGKQCKDCAKYAAHADNAEIGDCHSHKVVAGGSCNYFHAKE